MLHNTNFNSRLYKRKGTNNALSKIFDALASADKESIDFYEEWECVKDNTEQVLYPIKVEFKLDESKVRLNPNPIELTDEQPTTESDLTYRIQ